MTIATSESASQSASQSASDTVLRHLDAGLALPRQLYVSDDLFADEMAAIFRYQWMYAGHVSQIPAAGDYLNVNVGDESAIVCRDADGDLHGLLNVCRHRGARLVECDGGSARRFTCPYHQWTYALDGRLVGAPRMVDGFDRAAYPLKKVHTATWNGFVFVNFSPDPVEDLEELFAAPASLMAPFAIQDAVVAHTETYEVAANWKLVWENSQECYHCNANHPEFIKTFDNRAFSAPAAEEAPAAFHDDRRLQFGTFPLKAGACSLTMTGEAASTRLMGAFADGLPAYTASTHLKPGFATVFSPDYGIAFTDVPLDAGRTLVRVQWLVSPDAVAGVDYDVDNLIRVWDATNRQDWELCRSVQEGVRSTGFEPGPLSLDESSVAGFYYAYARMLAARGL